MSTTEGLVLQFTHRFQFCSVWFTLDHILFHIWWTWRYVMQQPNRRTQTKFNAKNWKKVHITCKCLQDVAFTGIPSRWWLFPKDHAQWNMLKGDKDNGNQNMGRNWLSVRVRRPQIEKASARMPRNEDKRSSESNVIYKHYRAVRKQGCKYTSAYVP